MERSRMWLVEILLESEARIKAKLDAEEAIRKESEVRWKGACDLLQKEFNTVAKPLLDALGGRRTTMETTLDTAVRAATEISNLRAKNTALEGAMPKPSAVWWFNSEGTGRKPLTFQDFDNTPCTADLEVKLGKLGKLATQFEEWHKEYKRDAWVTSDGRAAVFAQGKQDAYQIAAQRLRALLDDK